MWMMRLIQFCLCHEGIDKNNLFYLCVCVFVSFLMLMFLLLFVWLFFLHLITIFFASLEQNFKPNKLFKDFLLCVLYILRLFLFHIIFIFSCYPEYFHLTACLHSTSAVWIKWMKRWRNANKTKKKQNFVVGSQKKKKLRTDVAVKWHKFNFLSCLFPFIMTPTHRLVVVYIICLAV